MSAHIVEIRFNSKSSAQNIPLALRIAEKCDASYEGNKCTVKFDELTDPDVEKLVSYVRGLKGTELVIDGQEQRPRELLKTLRCERRSVCKGICIYANVGHVNLERVMLRERHRIRKGTLITDRLYLISILADFLEEQEENVNILHKDSLLEFLRKQTKFQADFCPKYSESELEKLIKKMPDKLIAKAPPSLPIRPRTVRRRQRAEPRRSYLYKFIETFYQAQIQGRVLAHYLKDDTGDLEPDVVLREILAISEENLNLLYVNLAPFMEKGKRMEYLHKALELAKVHKKDTVELAEIYLEYGDALGIADRLDEAIEIISEGLAQFEEDTLLRSSLVWLYTKEQKFKEALQHLERLLNDDPGFLDLIESLEDYASLRELPEYQKIIEKVQGKGMVD